MNFSPDNSVRTNSEPKSSEFVGAVFSSRRSPARLLEGELARAAGADPPPLALPLSEPEAVAQRRPRDADVARHAADGLAAAP